MYSITIRNERIVPVNTLNEATLITTLIVDKLKEISTTAVISLEGANSPVPNHFQCYIETTTRKDSIKRSLLRVLKGHFEPENDNEKKHWIKIKNCSDTQYLIGYCLKEKRGFTFTKNTTDTYLQECTAYYNSKCVKKQSGVKLTKNNIHYYFKEFVTLKGLSEDYYTTDKITEVLDLMKDNDYGLCWINKRNIYEITNYLKSYLNGTAYFTDLYNDAKEIEERFNL